ncbi:MAG: phage major capsid protein [Microbacterium sp.]
MSQEHIDRISESRARAWEEAKALLDDAATENRDLSAEEAEKFDRINKDLDELDARRQTIADAMERDAAIEESRARLGVRGLLTSGDDEDPADDDNEQIRRLVRGEARQATFESRSNTKSNVYGATPTSVYGQIVEHLVQANPVRGVATVVTTQTGENITVPTTSAFSTASIVGEGSQASASDPTFVNVRTLGAYKYLVLCQLSRELATDAGVDVGAFLARQAGTAIGVATRGDMTTGNGSSKPYGVVTNSTAGVTGGTGVTGAFTADDLISLVYSVTAPYRAIPGAGFMMNSTAMGAARKLKASSGDYVFTTGLQGNPDTILGYPVYVNESVASPALSAKSVIFGDYSRYFIREVNGITVETSSDFAFDYDVVTFKVILRTDGLLIDQTGAVKHFVGGAS